MIDRYARKEMKTLWSEDSKYKSWARVEKAHLEVLVQLGEAPPRVIEAFDTAVSIKTAIDFHQREQETNHDVIAFVAEVGDAMGDLGHFLHQGLTSSDVVDTSLSLRILDSLGILGGNLREVLEAFAEKSYTHAHTICMGRTHGIHAEPMSFGQILAGHFCEFIRAYDQLQHAKSQIGVGKLSGAVGTYSQLPRSFEKLVLEKLGLEAETIATQVLPRDRIATVGLGLLSCAQAVERFCTNVRHWARTELGEVSEPFSQKQKGSSAMPHKKNPILAENLCGLARTIRGYFLMLCENVSLWHERDISHSSVERIALPDMFVTLDFMLARLCQLVKNMEVHTTAMERNIWKTGGMWASQSVLTILVKKGFNRTKAYELVQGIAMEVSKKITTENINNNEFLEFLLKNKEILLYLSDEEIKNIFNPKKFLKTVEETFQETFGIEPNEFTTAKIKQLKPLMARKML